MSADRVPVLPRGVRPHFDRVRDKQVLLGPERALMLDQIGHAILAQVDGAQSLDRISERLAEIYDAPKDLIAGDVTEFLDNLAEQRLIDYV